MPVQGEDRFFGPKKGSANRAFEEMVRTYGLKEGTRVWHALLADRKKAGKTYGRSARG